MPTLRHLCRGAFALLALAALQLSAQQNNAPHIAYIFPAGGQQGTTFKVTIGGQYLDEVSQVLVTGGGFTATVVEQTKPLGGKEFQLLRDKIKELQEKKQSGKGFSAEDEKALADARAKIAKNPPRPPNPALAENVFLDVKLDPDARPGDRELRLMTKKGLTNPMVFQVGQLPEVREQKAKTDTSPKEMAITLPTLVNGQIMPGDVDRYRFTARKGQQIVVAAFARALIPYLADAVPGWFQATLTVFDAQGREVAYDDDYKFNPDPVLSYKIPADGDYVIEIKDSIFRGRDDFVYRLIAGELPFVTGIYPLGGGAGITTPVAVKGWNLPTNRMNPNVPAAGIHQVTTRTGSLIPNRTSYAVDTLPELMEQEPNNSPDAAQPVALPVTINGRINRPGDWDVFRFEGKAGQEIVVEVLARRLDSPVDSVLKLTDAAGKQLAYNDDHEDKGSGLNTHHADAFFQTKLPADGVYYVHLGDTQRNGGEDYAYRLRLSAPQPDFELRMMPSSINIKAGATLPITVFALRKDGFAGEIALSLVGAPTSFVLSGARIPAGQDRVHLTLTAPFVPPAMMGRPFIFDLEGRAQIAGKPVSHLAVPAEDMMQAFLYRHLVPSKVLMLAIVERIQQRMPSKVSTALPVKLVPGETARIKMDVPTKVPEKKNAGAGRIKLQLFDAPDGITVKEFTGSWIGSSELVIQCDAAKVKPGLAGNLILQAYVERDDPKKGKGKSNVAATPFDTLPAIPFVVVAPGTSGKVP